jgi:hypothetical protein
MFCPKCGQQQASGEMRFCSRCGFQLGVVSALIATGGVPPAGFAVDSQTKTVLTTRQTRQGAKLMFAAGVVAPFAMGFSILFDSPTPLIIPFTIFLAGLAWMLYYRLFGEDALPSQQQSSPAQLDRTRLELLTLPQNPMVGDFNRPTYGTAEIVQPRSVTENTTKLLDEK